MDSNPSNGKALPPMLMVGDVIVHTDIVTENFCCDIQKCQGRCCEEGDAGAPVTLDEISYIENELDNIWPQLSAQAQAVIDKQGVAYSDPEGELVTSIIGSCDCCFRGPKGCLLAQRPISCHLYPIREKKMGSLIGINYHRWDICKDAIALGKERNIRVYQFLKEPLIRRFGEAWYKELETVVEELQKQGWTP
ncbi:MAG: DUF3109 family protein [Bacteroidaceae bacterium]|nr:DUF3109 family protein [Bacteroidaceae bacterium]